MRDEFDKKLIAARPAHYQSTTKFTDAVMTKINKPEIFSAAIRNMDVTTKETFIMKLRHLPKFALIAIIVGSLLLLTGTTYAVVKTISELSNVKVDKSSTNEFGREQLKVAFNGCKTYETQDTTYELKKSSGLSADDGAKALQAACEIGIAEKWIIDNLFSPGSAPPYLRDTADTITTIGDKTVTLKTAGEREFSSDARVVMDGKPALRTELKVGDTVIYYPDDVATSRTQKEHSSKDIVLFKLSLEPKYYSLNIQSYVNPRGACMSNSERQCLKSNGINQTTLIVTRGGARQSTQETRHTKQLQGKVVDFGGEIIKLDVGGGVIYTVRTARDVVAEYNQTTVYGLASLDTIYAKSDPDTLKINIGDSLDVYYLEGDSVADDIAWSQVLSISLMVERIPNNLDVLRKY